MSLASARQKLNPDMKWNYTGLLICGALLASPLTTSCTSMDDRTLVKVETIFAGAAASAALACVPGAFLLGHDKRDGIGALGSAGLIGGIIIGNEWGNEVIAKKDAFQREIEWRKAHIERLDKWSNMVDESNANIQAKIKSGKVSAMCYKNTWKAAKLMFKALDDDIANAKNSGAANFSDVGSRVATLTAKRNAL